MMSIASTCSSLSSGGEAGPAASSVLRFRECVSLRGGIREPFRAKAASLPGTFCAEICTSCPNSSAKCPAGACSPEAAASSVPMRKIAS